MRQSLENKTGCFFNRSLTRSCPSADKSIRKLWYIYTMEYYSAIKKNSFESVLIRDETGAHYTEWSKPERQTPIQYTNVYMEF